MSVVHPEGKRRLDAVMYFGTKWFPVVTGLVILFVPRDSVMEMLFEQDNEEKSIASLILDTLVKVRPHQSSY